MSLQSSLGIFVFFLFLIGVLMLAEYQLTEVNVFVAVKDPETAKQQAVELALDYSAQMAGWAIAIVGAASAVLYADYSKHVLKVGILLAAIAAFAFCLISIFLSQVVLDIVLRMSLLSQDVLSNPAFLTTLRLQYFALLSGVVCFIMVVVVSLTRR